MQLNDQVLLLLVLPRRYISDTVLQPILHEDLFLFRKSRVFSGHLEDTLVSFELDLEDYGHFGVILGVECKLQGCLLILGCARVAHQVHAEAHLELADLLLRHPETSVEHCALVQLVLSFEVGVGEVDDVAEGGCVGSVELDFRLVLGPNCPIDFLVDKALHGVQVDDVLDYRMVQVGEYGFCEWLINVS